MILASLVLKERCCTLNERKINHIVKHDVKKI